MANYSRADAADRANVEVDASADSGARFTEIGPVELKGISGPVGLHAAHRAG